MEEIQVSEKFKAAYARLAAADSEVDATSELRRKAQAKAAAIRAELGTLAQAEGLAPNEPHSFDGVIWFAVDAKGNLARRPIKRCK